MKTRVPVTDKPAVVYERWTRFFYERWNHSFRVQRMNAIERGVYISALMLQAEYGHVPQDPRFAAQLMHLREGDVVKAWPAVKPHFEESENGTEPTMINIKMSDCFQWSATNSVAQNSNAQLRKAAQMDFAQIAQDECADCANTEKNAQAIRAGVHAGAHYSLSLSSHSDSCLIAKEEFAQTDCANCANHSSPYESGGEAAHRASFEAFWEAYPRKKDQQRAWPLWLELAPDEDLLRRISIALAQQKRSAQWLEAVRFIPYPANWIKDKRWIDEPETEDSIAQMPVAQVAQSQSEEAAAHIPTDLGPLPEYYWDTVINQIESDMENRDVWLKPCKALGYSGEDLWMSAPSDLSAQNLHHNYASKITGITGYNIRIAVIPDA